MRHLTFQTFPENAPNNILAPAWRGDPFRNHSTTPIQGKVPKANMVHSVSGWTRGVQGKLWDPLRTSATPERLRGVFTTRRYTNPRLPLPLPHLPLCCNQVPPSAPSPNIFLKFNVRGILLFLRLRLMERNVETVDVIERLEDALLLMPCDSSLRLHND